MKYTYRKCNKYTKVIYLYSSPVNIFYINHFCFLSNNSNVRKKKDFLKDQKSNPATQK